MPGDNMTHEVTATIRRGLLDSDERNCARPRLLDLFCGAGGAAVGYHRAGFDVVGVDIASQPHYPFRVTKADALIALSRLLEDGYLDPHFGRLRLADFATIHASPPCQRWTRAQR